VIATKLEKEYLLNMDFSNFKIKSNGPISEAFLKLGMKDFQQACEYVKNLNYQRTSLKSNLLLVLEEKRGTCSSKHALLKKLAEENSIHNIELNIGIYKMTAQNTPSLETTIPEDVPYIPEAHAYLVFHNRRLDFTRKNGKPLENKDILSEISISSDEMGSRKEQLHKDFIAQWCSENNQDFSEIWKIRESCIEKLSA